MVSTKTTQDYGSDPVTMRETDLYQREYIARFVDKWDELIDWNARSASEGDFFIRELQKRGARKVLDVATGTGFHSVRLLEAGFQVTSVDGSHDMLAKAFANAKHRGHILRTVQADWRWLNRDIHDRFDAVICLGNSFTHLHSENDRRKALAEFYAALRADGVLILDQRNYDAMLDGGYASKHEFYYCGADIKVGPTHLDPGLARFRYEFPDGDTYFLNMYPLRRAYARRLMREVGFQRLYTYGDFQEAYDDDDPDFFVHVAEKRYVESAKLNPVDGETREASSPVSVSRDYYNSSPADRFYHTIWGGEDIHIGLYEADEDTIAEASRRTVNRMMSLVPDITPETCVLDLGAGYGGAARTLAETRGCEVVCLNLSEVQNHRNRKLNHERGLDPLVHVVDGSFEDVPYPDERFDVVWSQDAFLHSGDREQTLSEAARVLRPDGTLIFTDPMQSEEADRDSLQPVLERIHLDSMGSVPFYRDAAARCGLEEERFLELTEHLVTHYRRVLLEIDRREDEMVEMCGEEYIVNMKTGLRHWIENGDNAKLCWGVLLFRKV